jgi:stress response protein YsnF
MVTDLYQTNEQAIQNMRTEGEAVPVHKHHATKGEGTAVYKSEQCISPSDLFISGISD